MLRRIHETSVSALDKSAPKQGLNLLDNHDKIKY